MPFYVNVGYKFPVPATVQPSGSVLLCSAMPLHQLLRRRSFPSHMAHLLFDPQLYLAPLDAHQCQRHCAYLATYPWFGVQLANYDSSQQKQSDWKKDALASIVGLWPGAAPTRPATVQGAARQAVDLQMRLKTRVVVLPSPLTLDPATSYDEELVWLDEGLRYAREQSIGPCYASVAISDSCLRNVDPSSNGLLPMIADCVSARGVDGVYLVVEQGGEPADARQCSNVRTVGSLLWLTHAFAVDAKIPVVVNFAGGFGLACCAAGASGWASGWYKSLYRLRLADQVAGGRAYPSFWSHRAAVDVHLEADLDAIALAGAVGRIEDDTSASQGLLRAARTMVSVPSASMRRFAPAALPDAARGLPPCEIPVERGAMDAELPGDLAC